MKKLSQLFKSKNETEPKGQADCILGLIGTGGSGKSAIVNRSGVVGSDYYIEQLKLNIYSILLGPLLGKELPMDRFFGKEIEFKFEIQANSKKHSELIEKIDFNCPLPKGKELYKLVPIIVELHRDEGLKKELFSLRKYFSYMESILYFTKKENLDRILHKDFELNETDIFFSSNKTIGISSVKYINNPKKSIVDTGGQRNERKKWAYGGIFDDNIKGIVGYTVSLSEFDQLCIEDNLVNRYLEGLKTFQEIYDSKLVSDRPLYLIFGKFDLLEYKIKMGVSFSEFVPEYDGDDSNVSNIVEFIVKKYLELDVKKKVIKHYIISARKSEQVFQMLDEIFDQNEP